MVATVGALVLASMADKTDFSTRAKDWTLGPVIYQVFVDRFVPPTDPEAKKTLFSAPRKFMSWDQAPKAGKPVPGLGYWSHELEFWGGDLSGVTSKLDYIESLGSDCVYLTPIFDAYSNHKYDTTDYYRIAPEFGTANDLHTLIQSSHERGMKVMLDGVFNHLSNENPVFKEAHENQKSTQRRWFSFGTRFKNGYEAYAGVKQMPKWRLEDNGARGYLWNGPNSVVRHWLNEGVDGWRLDVAFEIGPKYLTELTEAAHQTKPGSPVVGEVAGYPSDWFPALDGVFNFFAMDLAKDLVRGKITGQQASGMYEDMAKDAPYKNLLQSWLVTDNHDTERLAHQLPDLTDRHLVQAMQFTLPGAPVIYYGTELGMSAGSDPECRAPMRWDMVTKQNPDLSWVRKLTTLRKQMPALRYGDFKVLKTNKLLAYTRTTDKIREAVLVVVNPTDQEVTETMATRVGHFMSWANLRDAISGKTARTITGMFTPTVPPKSVQIYSLTEESNAGYAPHDRID